MALAISVSMAEKSGAFLGGGFQYSNLENQNTTRTPGANNNTPINTSIFGNNQTAPAPQTQSASKSQSKRNLDEKIREQVMKKSFKKLGFVSLATSSVLLGSMNATDLETYAALQKPSHVFGNYAVKKPLVANQLHQPHQLKRSQVQAVAVAHQVQAVAVAHQVQAVIAWQAS